MKLKARDVFKIILCFDKTKTKTEWEWEWIHQFDTTSKSAFSTYSLVTLLLEIVSKIWVLVIHSFTAFDPCNFIVSRPFFVTMFPLDFKTISIGIPDTKIINVFTYYILYLYTLDLLLTWSGPKCLPTWKSIFKSFCYCWSMFNCTPIAMTFFHIANHVVMWLIWRNENYFHTFCFYLVIKFF